MMWLHPGAASCTCCACSGSRHAAGRAWRVRSRFGFTGGRRRDERRPQDAGGTSTVTTLAMILQDRLSVESMDSRESAHEKHNGHNHLRRNWVRADPDSRSCPNARDGEPGE